MSKSLAIITTHPIQYNAPWFRLITERNNIQIKVFYTWSQSETGLKYDPGFGRNIEWDIPLLDGYKYEFVPNISKNPGTRSHKGIINPGLIKAIEQYSPDAILINGWNFNSHLKCLKYFHKKIPVLFRGDSTLLDEQSGIRKLLRQFVLTRIYKKVDFGLYVGTQNQKYFLKYGLKEKQLVFVPHAIDNRRFEANDANKNTAVDLRRKLNIPEDGVVFLFAGKLEPKKNPAILIETFKKIRDSSMHLVIVGNGELEIELKQDSLKSQNIVFMDFQNQQMMPAIYQMADVFVLPSKGPGETWGLAVNEAMAGGKPVLVSDKCGCAVNLVEDGKNGFIFQSGNLEDLGKKIKLLAQQKNNLKNMSAASLERIKSWSFEKIATQVEQLVSSFN